MIGSAWFVRAMCVGALASGVGCGEDSESPDAKGSDGSVADSGRSGRDAGLDDDASEPEGENEAGSTSEGGACSDLCSAASFTTWMEYSFSGNVTECMCSGGTGAITQASCSDYCAGFDVSPAHSYLSMTAIENDKCVCDGTQGPGGEPDAGMTTEPEPAAEVDGDGYPVFPADPFADGATGLILVSVTGSSSAHLPNGVFASPHNATASSQGTATFLAASEELAATTSLHVNFNVNRTMADLSRACAASTDVILRYGMPPASQNALGATSCTLAWSYDAAAHVYTGTLEAVMGDGVGSPSASANANVLARFAFKE